MSATTEHFQSPITALFQEAQALLEGEARLSPNRDLRRQVDIIRERRCEKLTDVADILNNLLVQAGSYSVVRSTLQVLYPDDIPRLDRHYGTRFFTRGQAPALGYDRWTEVVLAWGNALLQRAGARQAARFDELPACMYAAFPTDSQQKQPLTRLVLSLATALPVVKREILADPGRFLDRWDAVSRQHPGRAFKGVQQFVRPIALMGPGLGCNFFKELGLPYYVKVDVHVKNLLGDIGADGDIWPGCSGSRAGHKLSDRDLFVLGWLLAREAGMAPFFLDKILYVGGVHAKSNMRALFQGYKDAYIDTVRRLINDIPRYR